ncbi:MAG: acetoacetate decarboxylase [Betaproteobacteria bacterium]
MTEDEVRRSAFAMPLHNPAYPLPPYRLVDCEFLVIVYRSDPAVLRRLLPAPLELAEPLVCFEFVRVADSTFGPYCEASQVIPATLHGELGQFIHGAYLSSHGSMAAGRELWGLPKKLGRAELRVCKDTLMGTLDHGGMRIAAGTMGYKHRQIETAPVVEMLKRPGFVLKIVPHVDGRPRICELVRHAFSDVVVKNAWAAPGAIELHAHARLPVAELPAGEVVSAMHFIADLTLPAGTVAHDYLLA